MYYTTCYCGKSTQKEDRDWSDQTNHTYIKQLLCLQAEVAFGARLIDDLQGGFVEGLYHILTAHHASYSRMVISSTMQHRLVCSEGTRFLFSRGFNHLRVEQLEATLEGRDVKVRIKSDILNGKKVPWPDSLSDDYLG